MRNFFYRFLGCGLAVTMVGCGSKIDCKKLKAKLNECADEVYVASANGAVSFVERVTAADAGLPVNARAELRKRWHKERHRLALRFVERVAKQCRSHGGAFRAAKKINACLKNKNCKQFARCFAKIALKKRSEDE